MRARTAERNEFLADLLITAIEHSGYGFPAALEYETSEDAPAETYAVIYDRYEESPTGPEWKPTKTWKVDVDTMATGLGNLRRKYSAKTSGYLSELFEADRENDAGITDVVGALAVLEAALFGDITYS